MARVPHRARLGVDLMWLMDHPALVIALVAVLAIGLFICVMILTDSVLGHYEDELNRLDCPESALDDFTKVR